MQKLLGGFLKRSDTSTTTAKDFEDMKDYFK